MFPGSREIFFISAGMSVFSTTSLVSLSLSVSLDQSISALTFVISTSEAVLKSPKTSPLARMSGVPALFLSLRIPEGGILMTLPLKCAVAAPLG